MTIAYHPGRVATPARVACLSLYDGVGAAPTLSNMHLTFVDPDGYTIYQRHPPWSATDRVARGRYAYPYRAAARRACGYGSRLYDMRPSVVLLLHGDVERRTVMEYVYSRTFGIPLPIVPSIAPAPETGVIAHTVNSDMTRVDIDRENDLRFDRRRAFEDSLNVCGDFLRDVEFVRVALRFALHMIGASWKRKVTLGALFDVHAAALRSSRVFFDPARPLLSAEVQRFHTCDASPFWPGLLEHAEVCNPDDELRRVPWTGDVACTAALARASDEAALRALSRFPRAAGKARKLALL